jgi:hypothetical protein
MIFWLSWSKGKIIDRHSIVHWSSQVTSTKLVYKEQQKSVLVALYYSDTYHSHTSIRKGKFCIRISLHNMLMVPFRWVVSSSIKVKLKLIRYVSEIVYSMQCKQASCCLWFDLYNLLLCIPISIPLVFL